jgi:hypothetical protein
MDYTLPTGSVDQVAQTYTLPTTALPADFKVGDYISLAGECFIPQVPDEMHPILAQMVVTKIMEAIGDTDGFQIAQAKLQEMLKLIDNLIDDRTEGNPLKAYNKTSPLRLSRRFRNFRIGY